MLDKGRKKYLIALAIMLTNGLFAAYFILGYSSSSKGRAWLAPGAATSGHHQIIENCKTCHLPFQPVDNKVCLDCHAKDLEAVDDSHPEGKFTDPRNASLIEKMDATLCITCHNEHDPDRTRAFGVTMPDDFCVECHRDVGKDLKSHKGMAFNTCAKAGCHNYHDNQALYEDFLIKHVDDVPTNREGRVVQKKAVDASKALTAAQQNGGNKATQSILRDWSATAHAKAGVNCNGCHMVKDKKRKAVWMDDPGIDVCKSCHSAEYERFTQGKHGMRLAQQLSATIDPRLPLKIRNPELTCNSCHGAHRYEASYAATEACIGCHADEHTLAYNGSPHHLLWLDEVSGKNPPGSGVSCATCHMPRTESGGEVHADHNQSFNFQPNEKMVRSVCLNCHGLDFTLRALADPRQIRENFRTAPDFPLETMDMARERR